MDARPTPTQAHHALFAEILDALEREPLRIVSTPAHYVPGHAMRRMTAADVVEDMVSGKGDCVLPELIRVMAWAAEHGCEQARLLQHSIARRHADYHVDAVDWQEAA